MKPYYSDGDVTLFLGDCVETMRRLPENTFDAIVTDPPYGLEFMGKEWDQLGTGRKGNPFDPHGPSFHKGGSIPLPPTPSFGRKRMPKCHICGKWKYNASKKNECRCEVPEFVVDTWTYPQRMQSWHHTWALEALRVLKPGGHAVIFGGTRTHHRLWCAVEDAGFEVREMLAWVHGQGFPKNLNVSKHVDRCGCSALQYRHETESPEPRENMRGVRPSVGGGESLSGGPQPDLFAEMQRAADFNGEEGRTAAEPEAEDSDALLGVRSGVRDAPESAGEGGPADVLKEVQRNQSLEASDQVLKQRSGQEEARQRLERPEQSSVEGWRDLLQDPRQLQEHPVSPSADLGEADGEGGRLHHGASADNGSDMRPPSDENRSGESSRSRSHKQHPKQPRTVARQQEPQDSRTWPLCSRCGKPIIPDGLGTALKPAWEPILLCRKPIERTVAHNVQKHGTGALNVDGCRVGTGEVLASHHGTGRGVAMQGNVEGNWPKPYEPGDAGAENVQMLGRWPANLVLDEEAAAMLDAQSGETSERSRTINAQASIGYGGSNVPFQTQVHGDSGGASRFFYTSKAGPDERGGSKHPTVKPRDLMLWLCKLITPPGGLILDPFIGSGTTAVAARMGGFRCVGIDNNEEYLSHAAERLRLGDEGLCEVAESKKAGAEQGVLW